MAEICESNIEEMNLCMSNDSSTVVDFLSIDSKHALYNRLLSFFSGKRIEGNEINFDFLTKKISKWIIANSKNEIDLLFYIDSKIAHDDIFMAHISAAINNALIMAFVKLNRTPCQSELINKLSGIGVGISFYFIKPPGKSRRKISRT